MNIKRLKHMLIGAILVVVSSVALYVGMMEYKEAKRVAELDTYWAEQMKNEPKGKYEVEYEEPSQEDTTPEKATVQRIINNMDLEEKQYYNDLTFDSIVKEFNGTFDIDVHLMDEELEDIGLTEYEEGWDTTGLFTHWDASIYVENKEGKEQVLLHEIGHVLDFNGNNNQGQAIWQYSDSKEFKALFVGEISEYFKNDDYALTSRQEAFCDLVSEVVFNPVGLQQEAPNTYNYVRPLVEEILTLRPLSPKTF